MRHVVAYVAALCVAIFAVAVGNVLITILGLMATGVLVVAVPMLLLNGDWRTRARSDPRARRQYLVACAVAVVLPVAVVCWALVSGRAGAEDPDGGQPPGCAGLVRALVQSGEYTQEEAEQLVHVADPSCG